MPRRASPAASRRSCQTLGHMNAQRLASLLNYPSVWVEHGLLSAELVAAQSEQLVTECGAASAIGGTEH